MEEDANEFKKKVEKGRTEKWEEKKYLLMGLYREVLNRQIRVDFSARGKKGRRRLYMRVGRG